MITAIPPAYSFSADPLLSGAVRGFVPFFPAQPSFGYRSRWFPARYTAGFDGMEQAFLQIGNLSLEGSD